MPSIFLSYSHDDDDHKARVHALADRLAGEKELTVLIDRDVGAGGPDEGWPEWSERQVIESDRVLIACTEVYTLRYQGNDPEEQKGRGTVAEARTIKQHLYDSKGRNARFRVVLFDPADEEHIPHQLKAYHWFDASNESSYTELVKWLTGGIKQDDASVPEGPVWPEPDLNYKLALADRRPHLEVVRAALAGQSSNRIFLFKGKGNSGKTQFLNELTSYADRISVPWTRLDFKGAPTLGELFENMLVDLGSKRLPKTDKVGEKLSLRPLIADLKQLKEPVLFLFDTFEKASEESMTWLESKFLPLIRHCPAVIVVVGGRTVPDQDQFPWKSLAEHHLLGPIVDVEDWKEYISRVHQDEIEDEKIEFLTSAAAGDPGMLVLLLENLKKRKTDE